ncbi:MAG TPA: 30S ribosomal protein S1 [Verrucomicrobiales bacterium]|jgi:small subunit ribosomal protein S1|nr:30S ribosomal protein S1 [Pedosphaera sp.]HAL05113.1 30S ribosomal protein S1 [Verrucomicrobiales bacterium]HBV32691.1 30S ribosomal protein S1 [Verrucomicrobiales bacterium]
MEEALAQSETSFATGQIVKGTIIEIRSKEVMVDIGYKSEGSVPASEFEDLDEELKVGDEVDVLILQLEDRDGMVVLSYEQAVFKQNWDNIKAICEEGGRIKGRIKAAVKGGLIVNIGVEAFLPSSQIDVNTPTDLDAYVGQAHEFKVVKLNLERQNIVLSRRELIEEERSAQRAKLLDEMVPGDIRKGTVKNLTDFGAFIDLNGLDGLLHVTDMSWGRITHPSQLLVVGQELEVVVLDINKESERVSLGLKQKQENPWENIDEKFPIGEKVSGKVVNLMPYGAFVELEPGVEGLVHVTELSWTKRINKPSEVLKADQEIEAVVLGINRDEQKISLGVRQLDTNPWDLAEEKYPVGSKVTGKIRNLTSYGAFMGLEEGLDAMIHVSDISWTRKINHPSEVLKKGMEVEAQVLEVDRDNQRISAGIKQLAEDPWETIDNYYKVGDLVTGKVSKLASFGAFVGLEHDIDGLVHISQVSEDRIDKIKNALKVGEEVSARVIKIDRADRRIGLSIKAANYSQEQLKEEEAVLDSLKPGEDLVALQHAFDTLGDEDAEGDAAAEAPAKEAAAEAPVEEASAEVAQADEEAPAAEEAPAEDGEASSEE